MFKKEKKEFGVLRAILVVVGVVVLIMSAMVVLYKVFKKYFRITLECGDCTFSDEDCFCDEDYEPECCVYDGSCCGDIADDIPDGPDDDLSDDFTDAE